MRFVKSEIYFPIIILAHLALWGIDLSLFKGSLALNPGESPTQRVLGEVFSSWVMTVFAFNLLMATRARWVERIFGGLDKLYLIHRRAGVIAVAPVFKRRIPYDKWVKGHRIMGLFYVLGIVHALLVPTLIWQLPLIRTYVFGMAAIGVLSWLYEALLHSRVHRPVPYQVAELRRWGQSVIELTLHAQGAPLAHRAGQFAFFTFPGLGTDEAHPFTVASEPGGEALRVVIKASGDFTAELVKRVAEGDAVLVEGPYGHFTQQYVTGTRQVWVAGGIGITPFLALARELGSRDVSLYWSVRTGDEAFFDDELTELAEANPQFSYTLWSSHEQGYLGSDDVEVVDGTDLLICGPAALRDGLIRGLRSTGLANIRTHSEEFAFR